jgi:5'-3' exonuclease
MKILLIDTAYLTYRSYFGYPKDFSATVNGQSVPTGAIYGFAKTILALVKKYKPNQIIFTNDTQAPTWRHKEKDDYKAGRAEIEPAMITQLPLIKEWCKLVTANYLELDGWEADDLIYTVCSQFLGNFGQTNKAEQILIFSSDRDLLQLLVYNEVTFLQSNPFKKIIQEFGVEEFKEKYNLQPIQWLDYKALVGDNSDNLQGIPGIGPKTATDILNIFGSLYNLFNLYGIDTGIFSPTIPLPQGFDESKIPNRLLKFIELIKQSKNSLSITYRLSRLELVPNTEISNTPASFTNSIPFMQKYNLNSVIAEVKVLEDKEIRSEGLF